MIDVREVDKLMLRPDYTAFWRVMEMRHMTLTRLAHEVGYSVSAVSRIIGGGYEPRLSLVLKIVIALELTRDQEMEILHFICSDLLVVPRDQAS